MPGRTCDSGRIGAGGPEGTVALIHLPAAAAADDPLDADPGALAAGVAAAGEGGDANTSPDHSTVNASVGRGKSRARRTSIEGTGLPPTCQRELGSEIRAGNPL